eukprot:2070014-Rhodomonas_salina.1
MKARTAQAIATYKLKQAMPCTLNANDDEDSGDSEDEEDAEDVRHKATPRPKPAPADSTRPKAPYRARGLRRVVAAPE